MSALHRQDIPVETLVTCARGPCAGALGAGGPFPTLGANFAQPLRNIRSTKGVYLCIS